MNPPHSPQPETSSLEMQQWDWPRRRFLQQLTLLALGTTGAAEVLANSQPVLDPVEAASGYFPIPDEARESLLVLQRSCFTPHLNEPFPTLDDNGRRVALRLLEINDLSSQQHLFAGGSLPAVVERQLKENCFSLIFAGPSAATLSQRIYKLNHSELGQIELFLVPIGLAAGTTSLYEAVINRDLSGTQA